MSLAESRALEPTTHPAGALQDFVADILLSVAASPLAAEANDGTLWTDHALGKRGVMEFVAITHAGMTVSDFDQQVRHWLDYARCI